MAGRQAKVVLTAGLPLCLNSPLFTSKGEILKNKQTIKKKKMGPVTNKKMPVQGATGTIKDHHLNLKEQPAWATNS